ncbi:hypothetical protein HY631_03810 [Candidatus Uhrbacteria bacterium]|nr:hypothetical protein [Candidatus Uhrbacteria bacterium]
MARRDYFKQTQMKHYQRGRENPYFRRERHLPLKGLALTFGSLALLSTLLSLMLSHSTLAIREVRVDGLEFIDRSAFEAEVNAYLDSRALVFFHRSNQFLFSQEALEAALQTSFTFASLSVDRSGSRLEIVVVERTSNLIWLADTEYIVDLDGIVVRPFKREEAADAALASRLPEFYDMNEIPVSIGSPVLTPEEILKIFRFHEILVSQGVPFTQTRVNRLTGGWMGVVTQEGYEIYFDVTGDIEAQGERLKTILASLGEETDDLEYIDLRFGDRVYFK